MPCSPLPAATSACSCVGLKPLACPDPDAARRRSARPKRLKNTPHPFFTDD
jgi:hypothetical protein